jgi:hypothetical protein
VRILLYLLESNTINCGRSKELRLKQLRVNSVRTAIFSVALTYLKVKYMLVRETAVCRSGQVTVVARR